MNIPTRTAAFADIVERAANNMNPNNWCQRKSLVIKSGAQVRYEYDLQNDPDKALMCATTHIARAAGYKNLRTAVSSRFFTNLNALWRKFKSNYTEWCGIETENDKNSTTVYSMRSSLIEFSKWLREGGK